MILVTGGAGQLARSIEQLAGERPVKRVGRPAFDFDRPGSIAEVLDAERPSLVVNAAAWTAVDVAETNAEEAMRANRDGPAEIARWCAAANVPLIHVSSDYVFDGEKGAPYVETDRTHPTGVYGATKLAGEHAVLAACPTAAVIRTAWVYAPEGKNFVLTMLRLAETRDMLGVVADQRGCPTSALALARAILSVGDRIGEGWSDDYAGVFHAAGAGETTWHGLASAVFEEAARHGGPRPAVNPLTTAEFPTPVRRPADSRLDCGKLGRVFGVTLPGWRASLAEAVDLIYAARGSAAGRS